MVPSHATDPARPDVATIDLRKLSDLMSATQSEDDDREFWQDAVFAKDQRPLRPTPPPSSSFMRNVTLL